MAKRAVHLTESQFQKLVEDCYNELIRETGGDSLGVATLHTNTAYDAISAGKQNVNLTNGKTVNSVEHGIRANAIRDKQLSQFLNMYAGQSFVFNAPMQQGVLHIIRFNVRDIAYVNTPIVAIRGVWNDMLSGVEPSVKNIKVNTQTGVVTFYDPNSRSTRAVLNTRTRTERQWDAFITELQRFVAVYGNDTLSNINQSPETPM